jgi:hypothetical protein
VPVRPAAAGKALPPARAGLVGWLVWLAATAWCGQAAAGTVQGYVTEGSDGPHLAGVPLVLMVSDTQGTEREIARTQSDAQGRFGFADPALPPGLAFSLVALYDGASHISSPLRVGAQDEVIVEVYPPTTDASAISVATHSLFLQAQDGGVDVAQVLQIDNRGTRTYIGASRDKPRRVTPVWLPAGAYAVASHSGVLEAGAGDTLYDGQALPPGLTPIAFTFRVGAHDLAGRYEHRVLVPTDRFEVFVNPSSAQLGPAFEDLGTVDLDGTEYRRGRRVDLRTGEKVVVRLPAARDLGAVVRWIALAAALAAAGAVLWASARTRRRQLAPTVSTPPQVQALVRDRSQLICRLADLDAATEGQESDDDRRRERQRLLDQAVAVTQQLAGHHGGE